MIENRYLGMAMVKEEGRRMPHRDPVVEEEIQKLLRYGPYWTSREWSRLCKLVGMKKVLKKRGFI
jgi:hypothetical protein